MTLRKYVWQIALAIGLCTGGQSVSASTLTSFDPGVLFPTFGCVIDWGCGVTNVSHDAHAAQTFVAPVSGTLQSIRLFGGAIQGGTVPLDVGIYRTIGGVPSSLPADLLGSVTKEVSSLPFEYPGDWYSVDFRALEIQLKAEESYSIVLTRQIYDGVSIASWISTIDPYPGGNFFTKNAWQGSGAPWNELVVFAPKHSDLAFAVDIFEVPEPSSAALVLFSIAAWRFSRGGRLVRRN